MKTIVLRGKRWSFGQCAGKDEMGACEAPWSPGKLLDIPTDGDTMLDLEIIIHEAMHACLWDLSEESVVETARDVSRLLWRLEWRKDP